MALFAGKTPSERNKLIAAIVLGLFALVALFMAFGPSFRGTSSAKLPVTPTPSSSVTPGAQNADSQKFSVPSQRDQDLGYVNTPIVYNGGSASAPDSGRNIFAFYEPPPPTPWVATPIPIKTPTPAPPPPVQIAYVMPQNAFAGTGGFRMEVNGDRLTPDLKIYFNQSQMPTTFVSAQKLVTEIPAALIASEGPKSVIVQNADGKVYSNQILFNVQAPPKPQFTFIGMIARKHYNNDTAYFMESGKPLPTSARLNDVVGGRFRLISISPEVAVVKDTQLGFPYKLELVKASAGGNPSAGYPTGGFPLSQPSFMPPISTQGFPTMPANTQPRYPQPQSPNERTRPRPKDDKDQKDVDDNDSDTDN